MVAPFVSKQVKFEVVFTWPLMFLQTKAMQNNFRVFEELVFFDLWFAVSRFRFPVSDSGFQIPDSGVQVLGLP